MVSPRSWKSTASVSAPYSVISGGSYSLAAGASSNVTVRFAPVTTGTFNGTVSFTGGGGTSADVTGAGINPAISVTPSSRDYSEVLVGSTADQTFTVSNTGTAALTLLQQIERMVDCELVFPADTGEVHFQGTKTPWARAIRKA